MSTLLIVFLIVDVLLLVAILYYVAYRAGGKAECTCECVCEKPVVEQPKQEQVAVTELDVLDGEDGDDKDSAKRIPFAEKLLASDEKVQGFFDDLNNKFKSLRKINPRISVKGVSYRLGRELVAKITIRGKTMKLHLALNVKDFDEKIYFQKDMSDVKAYAEVPFAVKVKSDRGVRNAIKLIDELAKAKSIESKVRYNQVDSIALVKASMK